MLYALLTILILAKFFHLGIRPPHHDEAVNGWFVDGILKNGFYHYDPQNYHGPLYFYFLTVSEAIFGRGVEALRYVTIFFGTLLTLVPFLYRRWIGERASWIAAFLFAVSPAVFFYSRYAIHEVPFAFFTSIFFYFWLRAREEAFSPKLLLGLGLSLGAIACIKENFVIFLGCLFIAEVMVRVYARDFSFPKKYAVYSGMGLIAFAMVALIYSAAGKDPEGIPNFFKAFQLWSQTGSNGNGHEKPVTYWFSVLGTYEWATLLGIAASILSLRFRTQKSFQPIRLLSVLSMGVLMAYTIVSYKTPWCLLAFQWGFILVIAYWIAQGWDKSKPAVIVLLTVLGCHSLYQAVEVSYVNVDDDHSYYIYGQTYRDFMPPLEAILKRVEENPDLKKSMHIQIISQYTWPLPYVLGELEGVGYFTESNAPATLEGEYVMIDELLEPKYKSRLKGTYDRAVYRARQWASPMVIFTRKGDI